MDDQQGPEKLVVILDCRGASAFQVISPHNWFLCKTSAKSRNFAEVCVCILNPLGSEQLAMNSADMLLVLYVPDLANQAVTDMWVYE